MTRAKTSRNDKLIALYAKGFSFRELAARFRISMQCANQILLRFAPHLIRPKGDTTQHSTGLASMQRRRR